MWHCEEAGWWTHPQYGAICLETSGEGCPHWYYFPKDQAPRQGPYLTLAEAEKAAACIHAPREGMDT